jgi:GNAT superfamily N-acetyltransferase
MDNNIRIEHVGPEAIATIQKITRQVWPIAYAEVITPEQIEYMLDMMYSEKSMLQQMNEKGHRFLLLYYQDEAVGFAGFSFQEEKVHRLHKLYLYTHLHGLGLGKKLLEEVCKHSKMAGAEELELNVNRNNKAYFFYQKYGFTLHREEDIDIGGGFYMNDYVLRFRL